MRQRLNSTSFYLLIPYERKGIKCDEESVNNRREGRKEREFGKGKGIYNKT